MKYVLFSRTEFTRASSPCDLEETWVRILEMRERSYQGKDL